MVGSAAIKRGRLANRKHTYFFFWPHPCLTERLLMGRKESNQTKTKPAAFQL